MISYEMLLDEYVYFKKFVSIACPFPYYRYVITR